MKISAKHIVVLLTVVVLVTFIGWTDVSTILCKKHCRFLRNSCMDLAQRAYERCKQISEEMQCLQDLEWQKEICRREYQDCLDTCS